MPGLGAIWIWNVSGNGFDICRNMGIVIGIDVGGSTTKIIGIEQDELKHPMLVKAEDPVTSLFGAFGKYIYDNGISLSEVEQVMLTGVGSGYVTQDLYGLPTAHADEFLANGLGASYGLELKDLIVVSDIHQVVEMACKGDIRNVNLLIKDISNVALPGLPLDATASIFGKADMNTRIEDVAAGIIAMVLQAIGQSVVLAALNSPVKDFILIGNLTKLPQCANVFPALERLYGCRFLIPRYAEYRTALGAALVYRTGKPVSR